MLLLAGFMNFWTVSIIRAYRKNAPTCAMFATKWQLQYNNPALISTLSSADVIKADAILTIKFIKIVE